MSSTPSILSRNDPKEHLKMEPKKDAQTRLQNIQT